MLLIKKTTLDFQKKDKHKEKETRGRKKIQLE
jgi:hypothetical protein